MIYKREADDEHNTTSTGTLADGRGASPHPWRTHHSAYLPDIATAIVRAWNQGPSRVLLDTFVL